MALKNRQKGTRTIVISFTQAEYSRFMEDLGFAHQKIDTVYTAHPELFPPGMYGGYSFNGTTRVSKKLGIRLRKLLIDGTHYQISPSFVLSYMRAFTDAVEKPLFMLRFGVPFWGLSYVFGRDAMYWYRCYTSLSTYSVVGTSIKQSDILPEDLLADEHHIRLNGKPAYVATTCAAGCILGAEAVHGSMPTLWNKAMPPSKKKP